MEMVSENYQFSQKTNFKKLLFTFKMNENIQNHNNNINSDTVIKHEYPPSISDHEEELAFAAATSAYKQNVTYECPFPGSTLLNLDTYQNTPKPPSRNSNESPETRQRRLARNALRMREMRSRETEEQYQLRLKKNASANRVRRQNENQVQRALRLMKNAARQRLRRAGETDEERKTRLSKAAERMRIARANAPKVSKPPLTDRLIGY